MNYPSLNGGLSNNALSTSPILGNSKRSTDPWQVGAIWKRRRYLPNGDTAKRPIHLPPVQQAPSRLSSTLHKVLADCASQGQAHLPAIRYAAAAALFGTVSDPDPEIRSHMRAILQPLSSTTPSAAAQFAS